MTPQLRYPTSSLPDVVDWLLKGHRNRGSHRSSEEVRVARLSQWARRRGTNLRGSLGHNPRRRAFRSSTIGLTVRKIRHWARVEFGRWIWMPSGNSGFRWSMVAFGPAPPPPGGGSPSQGVRSFPVRSRSSVGFPDMSASVM
ncbi:hypothetical protein TIFTF001_024897 [Ficus carica]|uniref:Uncharacterized protein n=1 Tax=Ficus carica TaxID=3494 RepID=A0AA88AM29_FICCA|nr:hypothetical protein TIFTF001_024897 [Ficus carica]